MFPGIAVGRFGLCLALLLMAGTSSTLLPVRLFAAQQYGTVRITLTSAQGAAIPNARVTARNVETGSEESGVTNAQGELLLRGVAVGRYKVTVEVPGYKQLTEEIELGAFEAKELRLTLADVPEGTTIDVSPTKRGKPSTAPPKPTETTPIRSKEVTLGRIVEARERTFNNDLALRNWLDDKAKEGKSLSKIITVGDDTSIFLFEHIKGRKTLRYQIYLLNLKLTADELLSRLENEKDKIFVGAHHFDKSSYLLVFYDLK